MFAGFTDDTGFLDELTPDAPAAGGGLLLSLGTQRWLRLRSVYCSLTTDSNAATRLLSIDYLGRGGVVAITNAAPVLVTANTTGQVFMFEQHRTVSEWNTGTPVYAPLSPMPLPPGWQVQLALANAQAGDQLSSIRVVVERFYPPSSSDYPGASD